MNEEPIWPETPRSIVIERLKEYAPRLSKTCRKEGNMRSTGPTDIYSAGLVNALRFWLATSEKSSTGAGQAGKTSTS
jgi:hypothetical protein